MALSVNSKLDPYGFERPEEFDYSTYEEFMAKYLSVLARRAGKWNAYLTKASHRKHSRKLKRYVRKGIPSEHRAEMWMVVSGAQRRKEENSGLYDFLLKQEHDQEVVDTIHKDIHRTFPENIYFQDTPEDPNGKRTALTNVLTAIAQKHPKIGYCQGLNFIAGLLLLIVKSEQNVFWLMDTIVNLLPDYYTRDMSGVKVDQEVFAELVNLKMPEVGALMEKEGVVWPLICAKWFLCVFCDVMPVETTLRIWDCFFYEGPKIIFRVSLTLVKLNQDKILACSNFPDLLNTCKNLPDETFSTHCHQFMESIFNEPGPLSSALIEKLREKHRSALEN